MWVKTWDKQTRFDPYVPRWLDVFFLSYPECLLDSNPGGDGVALKPIGKVNNRTRVLARKVIYF